MAKESIVAQEVRSQPRVWEQTWQRLQSARQTLANLVFRECWDAVYFTGSGSSYYLALAAAALHQQLTGQNTRGIPASESALFPGMVYPDAPGQRILLVAFSRSGETTETLLAVEQHQALGQPALGLTCRSNSPLARQCQAALAMEEAGEEAIPQTRAFTSLYLAAQYLAGLVADDQHYLASLERLPALAEDLLERSAEPISQLAQAGWERIFYLGSGPYYGLACEGALKIKEMALTWSEAYHFTELRHGPLALMDGDTLVVGLLSDTAARVEQPILADARELGGLTLALAEQPPANLARYTIGLQSGLPELARGPLYVLPLQLLALARAQAARLDPDRPRHLQQAVVLEGL